MESPSTVAETQLETDDVVYPCKGCGEVGRQMGGDTNLVILILGSGHRF